MWEETGYRGIDKEASLVVQGLWRELGEELFCKKRPAFVVSEHFRFDLFDRRPDSQMQALSSVTGWLTTYVGHWNHPRGQKLLRYEPDPAWSDGAAAASEAPES